MEAVRLVEEADLKSVGVNSVRGFDSLCFRYVYMEVIRLDQELVSKTSRTSQGVL